MFPARWVLEGFLGPVVSMDYPGPREFLAPRDLQVRREMRDLPDHQDLRVLLATKAQWDHLGKK